MNEEELKKEAEIFAREQINVIIDMWRSKFPELPIDWVIPQYSEIYRSLELAYIAGFRKSSSINKQS